MPQVKELSNWFQLAARLVTARLLYMQLVIGPIEAQRIGYMVEDYGEEKVMEAMKLAFRNKGSNVGLNYIEAILSSY